MEILIEDFKKFKLSPSLIILLKVIHAKDNKYLIALDKVANVFTMAKWLQSKMIIKIIGSNLDCSSFEIRQLEIINYLNNESSDKKMEREIDEVLTYFKEFKKSTSIKAKSSRQFTKARLKEGYTVEQLKNVLTLKHKHWKDDFKMKHFIRIETFFNSTKFQGYVGELDDETEMFSNEDLNMEKV